MATYKMQNKVRKLFAIDTEFAVLLTAVSFFTCILHHVSHSHLLLCFIRQLLVSYIILAYPAWVQPKLVVSIDMVAS